MIAKTKKAIEVASSFQDAGLYYYRYELGGDYDQYSPPPEVRLCNILDLKALADSHTRLLEAAKGIDLMDRTSFDQLEDAIAEAENGG